MTAEAPEKEPEQAGNASRFQGIGDFLLEEHFGLYRRHAGFLSLIEAALKHAA
ncbi:hypothetical protein PSCICL_31270 [Pseudomonas cichorii]|nr:hypothetical protein PSCICL_31270 [Pseudomonas cichorii]